MRAHDVEFLPLFRDSKMHFSYGINATFNVFSMLFSDSKAILYVFGRQLALFPRRCVHFLFIFLKPTIRNEFVLIYHLYVCHLL